MNKQKEVIVLVGNIGSGKSTLTKRYQKLGYIVISRDQLRYAIGGGKYVFNTAFEKSIHATELYMYEKFLNLGKNIIIDETNMHNTSRKMYASLAKGYGYETSVIVLPKLTMKESVDRRMKDPHDQIDRKLWEKVWEKFDLMYEEPTKEEGFDNIIHHSNKLEVVPHIVECRTCKFYGADPNCKDCNGTGHYHQGYIHIVNGIAFYGETIK